MSKYLLVIDEPNDCTDCPCFYDYLACQAKSGIRVLDEGRRAKDCPLKPLPAKIEKPTDSSYDFGLAKEIDGWNCCIDWILDEDEYELKEDRLYD